MRHRDASIGKWPVGAMRRVASIGAPRMLGRNKRSSGRAMQRSGANGVSRYNTAPRQLGRELYEEQKK
jgi:hypothetical protein